MALFCWWVRFHSDELKSLATDVVRKIADVRRIYNELEIGEATGAGTRTNDTWITTQVKSKLLASSDTPGRRVKVVTENSVVYLMGLLTEAEADRVAWKQRKSAVQNA